MDTNSRMVMDHLRKRGHFYNEPGKGMFLRYQNKTFQVGNYPEFNGLVARLRLIIY